MNTQTKNGKTKALASVLVLLAGIILTTPASAQVNSRGGSVTLVATIQESVTVRYMPVPLVHSFAEGQAAPVEGLYVFLAWRLQPGQTVQVQPRVEGNEKSRSLLTASRFASMKQLKLESYVMAFHAPTTGPVLLGAVTEGEEKPLGRAALLLGAARTDSSNRSVVRITVAAL